MGWPSSDKAVAASTAMTSWRTSSAVISTALIGSFPSGRASTSAAKSISTPASASLWPTSRPSSCERSRTEQPGSSCGNATNTHAAGPRCSWRIMSQKCCAASETVPPGRALVLRGAVPLGRTPPPYDSTWATLIISTGGQPPLRCSAISCPLHAGRHDI